MIFFFSVSAAISLSFETQLEFTAAVFLLHWLLKWLINSKGGSENKHLPVSLMASTQTLCVLWVEIVSCPSMSTTPPVQMTY